MSDGVRQRRVQPLEGKQTEYYPEEEGMSWKAKLLGLLVLSSSVLGGATMLFMGIWDLFFPEVPERVSRNTFQSIVASGDPALVLCQPSVVQDAAAKRLYAAAKEAGVRALSLDCSSKTSSGDKTLYEGLQLQQQWAPTWFSIGMGRKPHQFSPHISEKDMIVYGEKLHRNHVMGVETKAMFEKCLRERSGGCLLSYSSLPLSFFEEGLGSMKAAYPTVQFGALNTSKRVLRFLNESPATEAFHAVVGQTISGAKEANALTSSKGQSKEDEVKGIVYVAGRKVPTALMDGSSGYYMFAFESSWTARSAGASGVSESAVSTALDNVENALSELRKLNEKYEKESEAWATTSSQLSKEEAAEEAVRRVSEAEEAQEAILLKYNVFIVHNSELQVDFRSTKKASDSQKLKTNKGAFEQHREKSTQDDGETTRKAGEAGSAPQQNGSETQPERVEIVTDADEQAYYDNADEYYYYDGEDVLDLDDETGYE